MLVTTSVCAVPWDVPGSLPNSFFLEASVQGYHPTCRTRCQQIYCSGVMQITLKKRDQCSSASRAVHFHLPFNAWTFFSEEVPEWVGCLPSFRGLFWFRLWKQLPNWNLTTITAPNEGDALFFLTTSKGFAKGICPQTTRTWGGNGPEEDFII